MPLILDGKVVSKAIKDWLARSVSAIEKEHGWAPALLTIQVGDDAASDRYIRNQIKSCRELGISAEMAQFSRDIKKLDFLDKIAEIENREDVDGIIIQRPLPDGWRMDEIIRAVSPAKDVEGLHPENLGRLFLGEETIPQPCTAWAAVSLLEWYGRATFDGARCAVIGRSPNVGRAAALMMMHRHATISVCHTRTPDKSLKDILAVCDIVIAAVGVAGIIDQHDLKPGAWVVDVGTNVTAEGKLVGDVAPSDDTAVGAISPVPGGVGPVTVALLMANLLLCATKRRLGKALTLPNLKDLREGAA